jgi:hypothetical protein
MQCKSDRLSLLICARVLSMRIAGSAAVSSSIALAKPAQCFLRTCPGSQVAHWLKVASVRGLSPCVMRPLHLSLPLADGHSPD